MSAVLAPSGCYHCGLPVPAGGNWSVTIDSTPRPMCCPGCQAVAQTIVEIGQSEYYRTRTQFAASVDQATLIPPELALYDREQFKLDDDSCEATLSVEGIRCAACVWLIERRLARLPGMLAVHLNVATERLYVRWQSALCQPSAILQAVREVGYAAYPYDPVRHAEQLQRAARTLGRQLFVAGLCMMQVMMYAVPAYLADDGALEPAMAALMRWASLLLTLPAICYSAQPFFRAALSGVRARAPGMDLPVALGITAAFGASVIATWRGQGEVWFDSTTMFIFLLLGSRYLELLARRKAASALERLQHALPASATRLAGWPASRATGVVAAAMLAPGDVILVKPGEAIAADAVIIEGKSALDMSLLSGESAPQGKVVGDAVPGGAINASAVLLLRVTRAARESTLSDLIKLVQRAGQAKPQIALWADRVASVFVIALLVFALASFGYWYWVDPARAWPIAIAVLVVSCPCALSLATPSALAAATDSLLRRGVLIVQPHVLETLHRATHIVFDKTGTLTMGRPVLQQVDVFNESSSAECLQLAAALEAASGHPVARAIVAAAQEQNAELSAEPGTEPGAAHPMHASEVQELPGQGLEGMLDGRRYRLGSAAFVAGISGSPVEGSVDDGRANDGRVDDGRVDDGRANDDRIDDGRVDDSKIDDSKIDDGRVDDGRMPVYLGRDGLWLARFLLADAVRDDAAGVIDYFRGKGKALVLLSGDQDALTQKVARELGFASAAGALLPGQKLAYVQELQRCGAVVAMVGDGINDAAVLSAADVSFAMGAGAALAQAHADAVLLSGRLGSLAEAARTAARTMSVMRQNLAWAALYNLAAIPAAALGYLNPWLSGVGMALSSALVVGNALRLRRT